MNVTVKKSIKNFKVYINEILHLSILTDEYSGIQSWIDGDNGYIYYIEYYLKNGQRIRCQYENELLWKEMLKQIDNNL